MSYSLHNVNLKYIYAKFTLRFRRPDDLGFVSKGTLPLYPDVMFFITKNNVTDIFLEIYSRICVGGTKLTF